MTTRIFVPGDSSAVSVGADAVADAVLDAARAKRRDVAIVRNGSRGLYWLEPLVEIDRGGVRHAYGPVTETDVAALFDAGFPDADNHPLYLGPTEDIAELKAQTRLTFARVGIVDPTSIVEYRDHEGFRGLEKALAMAGADIVEAVAQSGLRGRGGAGFPTGIKWRTVLNARGKKKYIVCNADEGDSGTFSDRMVMEGDPFLLIEGMIIAGLAVGADEGFIYLRSEYPDAERILTRAIRSARDAGYLGPSVAGSAHAFDIHLRLGAGAYICGEETSLLESLEGKRGVIRYKPPLPALEGLFGKPTVVNNVISLATVPAILDKGAGYYHGFGVERSRGTLPFQLSGNVKRPGLYELPFGVTLNRLIHDLGGGTASGRPARAVQVGGPLGAYFPESLFDLPLEYEAYAAARGLVGHGGVVVFDDTADLARQARFAMEFCAVESCGKCTPCRIGSTRGVETIDKILADQDRARNLGLLEDLCDVMENGSLCALGGLTPYPVLSALHHFPEDFDKPAPGSRRAAE